MTDCGYSGCGYIDEQIQIVLIDGGGSETDIFINHPVPSVGDEIQIRNLNSESFVVPGGSILSVTNETHVSAYTVKKVKHIIRYNDGLRQWFGNVVVIAEVV